MQEMMSGMASDYCGKRAEMLQRATAMIPDLIKRGADTEKQRKIHADTIKALYESELFRVCQPDWAGGLEMDFGMLLDVTVELGRGCGSTCWVYVNLAAHQWMLAMWPEQAQKEVWQKGPDIFTASSFIYPAGRATKVEDGYLLSGRWSFCSGIDFCDWIMVGGMEHRDNAAPEPRMFLFPLADAEIMDTWDVIGLAGTGSKDTVCENLFVPDHRVVLVDDVQGGPTPGHSISPAPHFQLPVIALFAHFIAAPIVGMALGVYDMALDFFKSRVSLYNKSKVAHHPTIHLRLAEASVLLDCARLLLRANHEEATRFAFANKIPPLENKVRWRRDAAHAATIAAQAANQLHRLVGGSVIQNSNPIQRQIRDLNAGLTHIGVSWDINGLDFGRVALGLPASNPRI